MSRIGGADRRAVEREILTIVGRLVAELGGFPFRGAVALDDSLDRDLGLGSLERVELLLRLEQAFGVRLPDAVMADAERPRDLAAAIPAASPPKAEGGPRNPRPGRPRDLCASGRPDARGGPPVSGRSPPGADAHFSPPGGWSRNADQ